MAKASRAEPALNGLLAFLSRKITRNPFPRGKGSGKKQEGGAAGRRPAPLVERDSTNAESVDVSR